MIDTGPDGPKGLHKFVSFKLNFLSAVDHPAQAPARAMLVAKRDPSAPAPAPKPSETSAMDPTVALANIQKRLGAILLLTAEKFAHFRTLPEAGQDKFLEMSDSMQSVEVQKALDADPVEVDLGDGLVVRKSAGPTQIAIAKIAKNAKEAQVAAEEIAAAQVYKARVKEDLSNLPLSDAEGVSLLVAVDTIKNDGHKTKILAALKAKNVDFGKGGGTLGVSGGTVRKGATGAEGETAGARYKTAVRKYADTNKLTLSAAYAEFENTPEGAALKAEHDEEQAEREASLPH